MDWWWYLGVSRGTQATDIARQLFGPRSAEWDAWLPGNFGNSEVFGGCRVGWVLLVLQIWLPVIVRIYLYIYI